MSENEFEKHLHALNEVEILCGQLICDTFAAQGLPFVEGQSFTLASLADAWHVLPQYLRQLQRLLRILTEEEFIRPEGDRWIVSTTQKRHDTTSRLESLLVRHPLARPEIILLQRCVSQLMSVLRGEVDPLRLLFPSDGSVSAADIYRDSVGGRTMNVLVAEAVAAFAAALPAGRTLRVLEIGAGTGATTESIQQRLDPDRTRYVFTDIAASFLPQARARFASRANMDFRVLDIERDPTTQGFDPGSFDLIVAANVLHATQDLHTAVKHTADLLAPGGMLVVLEGTRPVRWLDLIFGLTSGWWRFEDRTLRSDYPLLSLDAWRRLLDEVGFGAIRVVPPLSPQRNHHDDPGSAVIFAELDATSVALRSNDVPPTHRTWWVCADDSQLADALAALDGGQHDLTRIQRADVAATTGSSATDDDLTETTSRADWVLSAALASPLPTDVVFAGSPFTGFAKHDPATQSLQGAYSLMCVVQALAQKMKEAGAEKQSTSPPHAVRLWVVTCGVQSSVETDENLAQAGLWGFLRTVAQEHPHWDCRLVDLDADAPQASRMMTLLDELHGPSWDQESEIRFRNGVRQARRLVRCTVTDDRSYQQVLQVTARGSLSGLTLVHQPRSEPRPDEVEIEIHASGLNFRDVLSLLGQYPGEPPLGAECAGRVVRIGRSVGDVNVGDPVVAIAPGTFRSHVVVHRHAVARIPDGLSLEEAATIPVAYLTAQIALFELAQLRKGMRVLIHAATGGVGLAAVNLARAAGAEIFATASVGKHPILQQMGISHIYDSRRVGFAHQIRQDTDGLGVDVVLNTLGPEFVTENERALADGGTYVDLTKTPRDAVFADLLARRQLAYHNLDLAAMLESGPGRIIAKLTPLLMRCATRELAPLPCRSFALEEAEQAFRTMRSAQHVGKLLLKPKSPDGVSSLDGGSELVGRRPVGTVLAGGKFRDNATYLVTGGLGGLGLALARWLTEHGAGRVALMARRAPTESEQNQLMELQRKGACVELYAGDVSRVDDVESVLNSIRLGERPLAGVFHLAGTLDDGLVQNQTWNKMTRVFSAKAMGAWILHLATLREPLDHFVLFSSVASTFGSAGQSNHAAANAFMDALVRYRRTRGLAGQSINWGPWSGIGAAAARDVAQRAGLEGIGMLTPAEGMRALEHVLHSQRPQLIPVRLEWDRLPARWRALPLFALLGEQKEATPAAAERASDFRSRLALAPANQRYQILLSHLQTLAAQTLGVKEPASLPADQALADAGLDSLASLELSHRIEESLSTPISSTFVFDYPTLHDMADHFTQTLLQTSAAVHALPPATAPSRLDDDSAMRIDDDVFGDAMDDTLDDTDGR